MSSRYYSSRGLAEKNGRVDHAARTDDRLQRRIFGFRKIDEYLGKIQNIAVESPCFLETLDSDCNVMDPASLVHAISSRLFLIPVDGAPDATVRSNEKGAGRQSLL